MAGASTRIGTRRRVAAGTPPSRPTPRLLRIFPRTRAKANHGTVRVQARARLATAPGDETRDSRATVLSTRSNLERARALTDHPFLLVRHLPPAPYSFSRSRARETMQQLLARSRARRRGGVRGRGLPVRPRGQRVRRVRGRSGRDDHGASSRPSTTRPFDASPDAARRTDEATAGISRVPDRFSRQMTWHIVTVRTRGVLSFAATRRDAIRVAATHTRERDHVSDDRISPL